MAREEKYEGYTGGRVAGEERRRAKSKDSNRLATDGIAGVRRAQRARSTAGCWRMDMLGALP